MSKDGARFAVDISGETLDGTYRIVRELDRGGMGIVYLAEDLSLVRTVAERVEGRDRDGVRWVEELRHQPVVVKVPTASALGEPDFRRDFAREVDSLLTLRANNVVRVLARGETNEVPYLVLEHLPGGNLKRRIEASPARRMAAPDVLSWLMPIARALDWIHGRGFVHRDVKPANILFDGAGEACLADFGIAKALASGTGTVTPRGLAAGSPAYMAPEQGIGARPTKAIDQYALAVVVYEALSGRRPFSGGGQDAVAHLVQKQRDDPDPLARHVGDAVPAAACEAVMRALAKDPQARFSSCAGFTAAFASAFRDGLAERAAPEVVDPDAKTRRSAVDASRTEGRTDDAPEGVRRGEGAALDGDGAPGHGIDGEGKRSNALRWWLGGLVAAAAAVVAGIVWLPRGEPPPAPPSTPPPGGEFAILAPTGELLGRRDVRVEGTVTGRIPRAILVNATRAAVEGNRFTATVRAERDGPFELRVASDDSESPAPVLARTVVIDSTPPVVRLDAPGDLEEIDSPTRTFRFAGRVEDAHPLGLTADGVAVPLAKDGRFHLDVSLGASGEARVEFVATDRADHTSPPIPRRVRFAPPWEKLVRAAQDAAGQGDLAHAATLVASALAQGATRSDLPSALLAVVDRWNAPPVLVLESPAEGAVVRGRSVRLSGRLAGGRLSDRLELNGEVTVPVRDGRFSVEFDVDRPGPLLVTLRVWDGSEERARIERRFEVRGD